MGHAVRVFAYTGRPASSTAVPGVLHIHGGGQTASLDWVRYWTARGYACATFDICGEAEGRADVTDWGPVPARMLKDVIAYTPGGPMGRDSAWYHYTLAARRALTLLERLPGVDPDRLGVFGISFGGNLTWMVAGTDRRVRTAVPIYGSGWSYWRPEIPAPEFERWTATLAPETYARYVTCPLLVVNGTNDFNAHLERCYDSLARVDAETRQSFSFRTNHHLFAAQGETLAAWMRDHLSDDVKWPASPDVGVSVDADGSVHAVVGAERPEAVTAVEVAYAAADAQPPARFWRTAHARPLLRGWHADLALPEGIGPLLLLANVAYQDGFTLTSALSRIDPAGARPTLPRQTVIDDFGDGTAHWTSNIAPTDPWLAVDHVVPRRGLLVVSPAESFSVGTHKVGDPQFRAPEGAALAFKVTGAETLRVEAWVDHWGPGQRVFKAAVEAGAEWSDVRVATEDCRDDRGEALPGWSAVNRLDFVGTAPSGAVEFAEVRWTA
jgi:dienelactone hydrolase